MSHIENGEILYRYANPNVFPTGQTELPTCIVIRDNSSYEIVAIPA